MSSPKKSREKALQTKGSKANLGQKKAEREEAAERQLSHMGSVEKSKPHRSSKEAKLGSR